jgi:putative CocE/NonD family hydrolase
VASHATEVSAAFAPGVARGCRFARQLMVPMRDGTRLAASVFLPRDEGSYPVVMQRTPYNRLGALADGERWAARGYAFVSQDVRGRYDSEGEFDPFLQEIDDTPDTIAWLRGQPWCDGRVGLMGPSYLAWIQTMAVARGDGAMPDAILPTFAPASAWRRGWYANGPLSLFLSFWWMCFDVGSRTDNSAALTLFDIAELLGRLPLQTLDVESGAGEIALWREVVDHPMLDGYWDKFELAAGFERFAMPALHVAGWYDYYPSEMIADWQGMAERAPDGAANHRLLIGPWGHHHGFDYGPGSRCAVDFGPDGALEPFAIYAAWFDRVFGGAPAPDGLGERPIRLFVMGLNQWRDEDEWPLARTVYTDYYLHSGGSADAAGEDGRLDRSEPEAEPPDRYVYDPADPAPTHGGNHSIGPGHDEYGDVIWCGPYDQREIEARSDVLSYTSAPLEHALEATGPVTVHLWASSDAPDTDFVARLVDVHPDGLAVNLAEGIVRARFRSGDASRPRLIEPGAILEYVIDLQCTSNVFAAGHRIRLDVTSSSFPLWDRNLNTGEHPSLGVTMQSARQAVWHDAAHPSRLVLPVIPG